MGLLSRDSMVLLRYSWGKDMLGVKHGVAMGHRVSRARRRRGGYGTCSVGGLGLFKR